MPFPAEPVPDGAFFAPHHFLLPLYVVLIIYLLRLDDDPEERPALILVGVIVALVGWFHFWPYYPKVGTVVALVGVLVVMAGGIVYRDVAPHWRFTVVVLGIVALDDWIDHALPVETPASVMFQEYIRPLIL